MSTERTDTCPPVLFLEGYALESLPDDQADHIKLHLDTCSECLGKLETIQEERQEFLAANPAAGVLTFPETAPRRKSWQFTTYRLLPVAAVLVLALTAVFWQKPDPNTILFKGDFSLNVYVTRGDVTVTGKPGVHFPGDQLQFAVLTETPQYLYIINIDDEGRISFYYPGADSVQKPVSNKGKQFLPISITLDDYIGFERIFVLSFDEMQDLGVLQQQISAAIRDKSIKKTEKLENINADQKTYFIEKRPAGPTA